MAFVDFQVHFVDVCCAKWMPDGLSIRFAQHPVKLSGSGEFIKIIQEKHRAFNFTIIIIIKIFRIFIWSNCVVEFHQ